MLALLPEPLSQLLPLKLLLINNIDYAPWDAFSDKAAV